MAGDVTFAHYVVTLLHLNPRGIKFYGCLGNKRPIYSHVYKQIRVATIHIGGGFTVVDLSAQCGHAIPGSNPVLHSHSTSRSANISLCLSTRDCQLELDFH